MKWVDTGACVHLCKWLNEKKQGLSVPVTVHQGGTVSIFSRLRSSEHPLGGAGALLQWGASAGSWSVLCQLSAAAVRFLRKLCFFYDRGLYAFGHKYILSFVYSNASCILNIVPLYYTILYKTQFIISSLLNVYTDMCAWFEERCVSDCVCVCYSVSLEEGQVVCDMTSIVGPSNEVLQSIPGKFLILIQVQSQQTLTHLRGASRRWP